MKKYRHTANVILSVILLLMAMYLLIILFCDSISLDIRNGISLLFTAAIFIALFKNQNLFTLFLGITLLIGNFAGLSSFVEISTNFLYFNIGSLTIPLYWGQPSYSLLLFIYIIFNKGFYIGVLTKDYWHDFTERTKDLEVVLITTNKDEEPH